MRNIFAIVSLTLIGLSGCGGSNEVTLTVGEVESCAPSSMYPNFSVSLKHADGSSVAPLKPPATGQTEKGVCQYHTVPPGEYIATASTIVGFYPPLSQQVLVEAAQQTSIYFAYFSSDD